MEISWCEFLKIYIIIQVIVNVGMLGVCFMLVPFINFLDRIICG